MRPLEHDGIPLHADLERSVVADAKPLADLHRDDDAAELVDAAHHSTDP
jgi:hypothetical protein